MSIAKLIPVMLPRTPGAGQTSKTHPNKSGQTAFTKPCEFIGFGAMDVTKPYEFIGFGAEWL